jgi:hypothetical protein
MAGTVTTSETVSGDGKLYKVVFSWTSHTDGKADGETGGDVYVGQIIGATTIPGTSGDQPDDNYNIRVLDDDGHDVCLGALSDRDETDTEHVTAASMACVLESALTLEVTDAGSTHKGTLILWISRL